MGWASRGNWLHLIMESSNGAVSSRNNNNLPNNKPNVIDCVENEAVSALVEMQMTPPDIIPIELNGAGDDASEDDA